jgi:signal transduction histidine kinase
MKIRILLLGVTDDAARAFAEEGAGAGVSVEVAAGSEDAVRRVEDPANRFDAVVTGPWEKASVVAKTLLSRDGRLPIHVISDEAPPRGLIHALAEAARARGERQELLLAMIAHDVRAPVGVALGALSELGHPSFGALDAEQRMLVRLATRSVHRLQKTADNISILARIDAGRLEVSKARADVGALAREAALRLERDGEIGDVKLALDAPSATAPVDRERFGVALENVLSNAARFARTRVEVRVRADAGGVSVVVEDDGPGLPANLSDPFDRIGIALARPSKTGSGFGLAVVRGVLVAHGGEANAENVVESGVVRGARFTLRVPSA